MFFKVKVDGTHLLPVMDPVYLQKTHDRIAMLESNQTPVLVELTMPDIQNSTRWVRAMELFADQFAPEHHIWLGMDPGMSLDCWVTAFLL